MDFQEQLQTTLGSAYRLERELGGGGMSRVFVAAETSLGRRVVVKVLPPDLAAGVSTERFRKEIQLAASLQHPHIVAVLAAGQADGLLYYTMPYIEGESLRALLLRQGELPVADALRILRDVARAIAYAHRHGVVHRDIKPENVLLSEDGAMVADFGVAKALSASTSGAGSDARTGIGVALGTPAYMAPEQAAADPMTDHRADLYALGIVAYELLAGFAPFAGRSMNAVFVAHASETPEPIEKRRSGVPPRLAALIAQCLQKRPADRPQSADAVVRELDAIAMTLGAQTGNEGPTRLPGAFSRHRAFGIVAAAAVLLLVTVVGYRMLTGRQVVPAAGAQGGGTPGAEALHTAAVLPFANQSADKEDESFSDGMTEELISALGKIEGLRVKSAFSLKGTQQDLREVGKQLGVQSVVTGSVQRSGGLLRVSAHLVNVADGFELWSESYKQELRNAGDVFRVQDDIAKSIVSALKLKLAGAGGAHSSRQTENLDAYNLYLRGRYFWNKRTAEGLRTAVTYFEQALAKDPGYALAYDGLADAHALSHTYGFVAPDEAFGRARQAVAKALELDSTLAEGYATLGYIGLSNTWDWAAADRAFKRSIQLNANYATAHQWYSLFLDAMGRGDDALREMQRALELDPISLVINREYGRSFYYMGDNDRALKQFQRTLELDPSFSSAHVWIARVYIAQGRFADAVRELQDRADFQGGHSSALLAYAYARSGDRSKALALLEELSARSKREHVWPMFIAMIHLGLGDRDRALSLLEQEYADRSGQMAYVKVDPMFTVLHGDPRFDRIIQKMNFPHQ